MNPKAARIGAQSLLIDYFMTKDFALPSLNIRFRMLQPVTASTSCDFG